MQMKEYHFIVKAGGGEKKGRPGFVKVERIVRSKRGVHRQGYWVSQLTSDKPSRTVVDITRVPSELVRNTLRRLEELKKTGYVHRIQKFAADILEEVLKSKLSSTTRSLLKPSPDGKSIEGGINYSYSPRSSGEFYIDWLAVHPDNINEEGKSKKKGIGSELLVEALKVAQKSGAKKVRLFPIGSAVGFYKKFGFVKKGFAMELDLSKLVDKYKKERK